MKIGIGTANFNIKYGPSNKKIEKSEFNKIKKLIKKNDLIDTADGYNNYNIIKKIKDKDLRIVTKIKIPPNCNNLEKFILNKVENILKIFSVKNIYGLLIHDIKDVNNHSKYLEILDKIKNKKLVKKIGLSIYKSKELKIIKRWKPDIVQFPLNIFDQRFKNKLHDLKKRGIELHSRSCFLQGLLIGKNNNTSNRYKIKFNKWEQWCKKNNLSRNVACINFVRNQKLIDYLVLGFENSQELKDNISIFKKENIKITSKFKSNNLKLIDPRQW